MTSLNRRLAEGLTEPQRLVLEFVIEKGVTTACEVAQLAPCKRRLNREAWARRKLRALARMSRISVAKGQPFLYSSHNVK